MSNQISTDVDHEVPLIDLSSGDENEGEDASDSKSRKRAQFTNNEMLTEPSPIKANLQQQNRSSLLPALSLKSCKAEQVSKSETMVDQMYTIAAATTTTTDSATTPPSFNTSLQSFTSLAEQRIPNNSIHHHQQPRQQNITEKRFLETKQYQANSLMKKLREEYNYYAGTIASPLAFPPRIRKLVETMKKMDFSVEEWYMISSAALSNYSMMIYRNKFNNELKANMKSLAIPNKNNEDENIDYYLIPAIYTSAAIADAAAASAANAAVTATIASNVVNSIENNPITWEPNMTIRNDDDSGDSSRTQPLMKELTQKRSANSLVEKNKSPMKRQKITELEENGKGSKKANSDKTKENAEKSKEGLEQTNGLKKHEKDSEGSSEQSDESQKDSEHSDESEKDSEHSDGSQKDSEHSDESEKDLEHSDESEESSEHEGEEDDEEDEEQDEEQDEQKVVEEEDEK